MEENTTNPTTVKEVPILVKVLSVLYLIGAITIIVLLIISLINLNSAKDVFTQIIPFQIIILTGLSVFLIFTAKDLWRGKSWARKATIIFSISMVVLFILILLMVTSVSRSIEAMVEQGTAPENMANIVENVLSSGIIQVSIIVILVNGLIGAYFLFNKRVKEVFKNNKSIVN